MRVVATRPFSGGEPRLGRLNVRPHGLVVAWDDGSYWSPSPDDLASWALDLADPATAGVLLEWLPNYEVDKDERGARVRVGIGDDWQPARDVWSTTLGEAVARALLACWQEKP